MGRDAAAPITFHVADSVNNTPAKTMNGQCHRYQL